MIFPCNIKWNAQLCSTNVENKSSGGFQPVVAVLIRKIVASCVIFSGVFNLRSKDKGNGTQ